MARKVAVGLAISGVGALAFVAILAGAHACPLCQQIGQQTLTQEIGTMDASVVARLVEPPPPAKPGEELEELPKAKFEIVQVLKGEKLVQPKEKIATLYFGSAKPGTLFFINALNRDSLMWTTPMPISARGQEYLTKLQSLPKEGADRLAFFQDYLDDEDDVLARDAYDEFARAPYAAVKELKPRMKHDKLVEWIQSPDVAATRRRLYFMMLGICGNEKDLPLLESFLNSSDRKVKSGLDALIACYVTLRGAPGLDLIDDLYLKRKSADYAETYSAIMALRFHATEGDVVPKKRVLESMRLMLDRPELADLIISDLAKWEDWESMDKLMDLYRKADEKSSWVRTPVVVYLRACPLPKAKEYIEECKKLDPVSVKRAMDFFPAGPVATPEAPKTSNLIAPSAKQLAQKPDVANDEASAANKEVAEARPARGAVASLNLGVAPAAAARQKPLPPLGLGWLLGVPAAAGVGLFLIQRQILVGGR